MNNRENERRASPRRSLARPLACRLAPDWRGPGTLALLTCVSSGGAGLYVGSPVVTGRVVPIELADGPAALRGVRLLRLFHCRPADDGGFLAGGRFETPLTKSQIDSLAV